MAKPKERVFALIMALLFLVTTVAVSALVVWQVRQQRQIESEAQTPTANQQTTNNENQIQVEEGKLKGTTLQNYDPVSEVPELQKIDLKEGDGEEVKPGATVTAHYTGAFAVNGLIFESSKDGGQPIPFSLDGVIAGWTQGVPGMKVGGVRRLVIPGLLAYGDAPAGYQPSLNSQPLGPLVFDIELTAVENK